MPDPTDFLKGFSIHKNLQLAGFKLQDIIITHERIKAGIYNYHIKLKFAGEGDANELLTTLKNRVAGDREINSRWGNPYICNFGTPYISESYPEMIIIESLGTSHKKA